MVANVGYTPPVNSLVLRLQVARDYVYNTTVGSSFTLRDLASRNSGTGLRTSARLVTSAGFWNATITTSVPAGDDAGQPLTFSIVVKNGGSGASSVVLFDNKAYDPIGLAWQTLANNTGVLITLGSASSITVAQLETTINTSGYVQISRADSFQTATLADTTYLVQRFGQLSGGVSGGTTAVTYEDDSYFVVSPNTVGRPIQVRFAPTVQRCEAFKVRITSGTLTSVVTYGVEALSWNTSPSFPTCNLTGIGLEVGIERGLYRRLPAAQKV